MFAINVIMQVSLQSVDLESLAFSEKKKNQVTKAGECMGEGNPYTPLEEWTQMWSLWKIVHRFLKAGSFCE